MASVDEIINSAKNNAERMSREASDALRNAVSAASASKTFNPVTLGEPGDVTHYPLNFSIPEFNAAYAPPDFGVDSPTYTAIEPFVDVGYPDGVTINLDGLFEQRAPDFSQVGDFTDRPPDLDIDQIAQSIDAVPTPVLREHEAPTLSTIDVGDAPSVDLPEFQQSVVLKPVGDAPDLCDKYQRQYDAALPVMRGLIDDTMAEWVAKYAPNLRHNMSLLDEKLEQGMESGNALSEEFESGLYNRARARAESERERVQTELETGVAKRGFTLPQGVINSGRVAAHQQAADNIAIQSIELSIERAKMEIQHVQFSMQLAQGVHQMLIGASLQYAQAMATINGQALEFAKQAAMLAANSYELTLRSAELDIAILNAEARIYEVELQASLAVYEEFRLRLEAAKAQTDIDLAKVKLYTATLDAETTKIQQYAAVIDGIKSRAELEKLKVDIYGEQVKAYVASLSGIQAETQIYVAALKGDEVKMKGELARVDSYAKEVDAAVAKQRSQIERSNAITASNRDKTEQYKASVSSYQVEVSAEAQRFRSETESHEAALATVATEMQVKRDVYKSEYDALVARAELIKQQAQADIENIRVHSELFLKRADLITETNVAVGEIYSTMASATLSSQNTMVSKIVTE